MTKRKLSKKTLSYFLDSGLDKEHVSKMGIRDIDPIEMGDLFKNLKGKEVYGHELSYFDLAGNPTEYKRYRLHNNDDENLPKYLQIAGQKSRFYFPPFLDWKKIASDPSITIYITEGERKAAKACTLGYPCIGLGGVWNWKSKSDGDNGKKYSRPIKDFQLINWKNRRVIIVFDSDTQFNPDIQNAMRALRNQLVSLGADPYRVDLPHKAGDAKVGLDDFLKEKRGKKLFDDLPRIPLLLNKTMTGTEILKTKNIETNWFVKGLIPSGLTVLSGAPKTGKSWLVLELVLAISSGQKALDYYEVTQAKCLYLALEDSPSRLKKRILHLGPAGYKVNNSSSFAYEWELVENGGLMALERRLDDDPNCKVVFIDTFAKVRTAPKGRENLYHQDYEAVATLKRIADRRGIGIVVVHHTKKGQTDDFLESVSGSMGITGAADTVIVLRRERNCDDGVLYITGRDVGEQAIAISHNNGAWVYKGEASAVAMTETQEEILSVMRSEGRPLRQKEIADLSGRKNQGFTKTLARMVQNGLVSRDNNNRYTPFETPVKDPPKFAKQKKVEEKTD